MPDHDFPILPSTKIAALLERYPELEEILIGLAPPFQKLKNPLLRKGVARVASLKQAAAVGGLPVADLINKLRAAVGQEAIAFADAGGSNSYFASQPEWFAVEKIVTSIDETSADPNQMPIVAVLQKAAHLQAGEILELVTTFLPAPGIEILKKKGLRVWSVQQGPALIRTYISKPSD
jgi:TusA-related sulfurtransferase